MPLTPVIRFGDARCELREGESVLDGLLRQGVPVAHACRAGSCGSCMLRAVEGEIPAAAQAGLKDSWKAGGYFLACICRPEGPLTVAEAGSDARVAATISSLGKLAADVLRVGLTCTAQFPYRAGQYLTLIRDSGLARSYSIASLPEEAELELHVRLIPGGRMSGWLAHEARLGDKVVLQGPSGECFYVSGREDQPVVLIGTGTGLAPLRGIVRDALRAGHRGPLRLFHGARTVDGLYLREELAALAAAHANFTYVPTVLDGDGAAGVDVGPIDRIVAGQLPGLGGWRGFVCGDPALVQNLKRKLFLSGMALNDICADAFLPAAL